MDILRLIEAYAPGNLAQQNNKDQLLAGLYRWGEHLLYRDCLEGHISASAIIVNPDGDKTLMVHHNIYHSFAWTGGHADGDGNLLHVALKEAKEETGVHIIHPVTSAILSIDILPVPAHVKNGKAVAEHLHYNVTYGFICPDDQALHIKPDENTDVKWLPVAELGFFIGESQMVPLYQRILCRIQSIQEEKNEIYRVLSSRLLPWYRENARDLPWRNTKDPYHVWLSEIMLQQTRVDTATAYYQRFLEKFPDIRHLANGSIDEVLKAWEGLGYYSRARNLHKAAKIIMEQYGGTFPNNEKSLRSLPGIGAYTAGAILSICFDKPAPAVDGNVLRVISRLIESYYAIDDEKIKKSISNKLAQCYPKENCGDFTQSLMELGATVCLPNGKPLCENCPLGELCMARKNNAYEILPIKKAKKERKIENVSIFILHCDGFYALERRDGQGVLKGFLTFPHIASAIGENDLSPLMSGWGLQGWQIIKEETGKHIFTHIEWHITCYHINCENMNPIFTWRTKQEIEGNISLPTAFKKFFDSSLF